MSARHFHRSAGPFTICLFYNFISIRFQARGFCISGRKTCMSARHFHRSAETFSILLLFDQFDSKQEVRFLHLGLPILHVRRSLASPRVFLHLGPPTLHVGSRFLHVGPPIRHVRRTSASPKIFVASRTANPACRLTPLHADQTYPRDGGHDEV